MNRGYTCLWRKTWANPVLQENGKKFSRLEAWLYMTNVLAASVDDESSGVRRGELAACGSANAWRKKRGCELWQ